MSALIAQADEQSCPGASAQEKTRQALALLGGLGSRIRSGERVVLKPNFVAPFAQAATSLEVIEAVVEAVRAVGGEPVIAESSGFEFDTEATCALLGVCEWARARGVTVLNLDEGPFTRVLTASGFVEVARVALSGDPLINLPKLKRHSLTGVTLGIKNLMGLLSRDSRRWLHAVGLERGLAALAQAISPELTVLDALTVTSRAVYGESAPLGMILASRDMVALDCYACSLLGEDPQRIAHIREGIQMGLGESIYRVEPARSRVVKASQAETRLTPLLRAKPLYRLVFRAMYLADLPFSRLAGRSLIPYVHYWLGIRPHLEKSLCDRCGRCAGVCPVGAIQVEAKRIIPAKCMRVRCMRCVSACPRGAIRTRGRRVGAR